MSATASNKINSKFSVSNQLYMCYGSAALGLTSFGCIIYSLIAGGAVEEWLYYAGLIGGVLSSLIGVLLAVLIVQNISPNSAIETAMQNLASAEKLVATGWSANQTDADYQAALDDAEEYADVSKADLTKKKDGVAASTDEQQTNFALAMNAASYGLLKYILRSNIVAISVLCISAIGCALAVYLTIQAISGPQKKKK